MRKEEIRSLIVYAVLIIAALIVGLTVIRPAMDDAPKSMSQILFLLVVVLIAYLFNAIALEILHVIGAKLGGYKVTSVNVLWLCFYNDGKTWKVGFKDFNGVCGETRIAPKKEKLNANLLSWLPLFGFAAELAGCIVVNTLVNGNPETTVAWLAPAALIFLLISSLIAFYNFIPLKLDSFTDGYRIRLFTKPVNIEAYNQMLAIQEKQRLGEKVEKIPVFSEITEYTAEININAMYECLEKERYDEAIQILDHLLENRKVLGGNDVNRLIAQRVYLAILTSPVEEAKKLYDEICPIEVRRFIVNDNNISSLRAYVLIAGMLEGSESEVLFAKSKIEKAKKRTPASVKLTEEKLLNKALDMAYEAHPKWKKEDAAQ